MSLRPPPDLADDPDYDEDDLLEAAANDGAPVKGDPLIPPKGSAGPYLDPDLPAAPFAIDDGQGGVDGPYFKRDWSTDPDGVWCNQTEGCHPVFLRVVHIQPDGVLWTLDGAGDVMHYRLVPMDQAPAADQEVDPNAVEDFLASNPEEE